MRFFLALTIALSACASTSGPRPINVAAVRHQINDTIQAEPSADRSVTSMGAVRESRAVVYTTNKAGVRQEETWIKDSGGWKLEKSTAMN
ncbi:MAG: hypothetical protein H0T46_12985 [Deltaproteobacteria bacterium]|nr:hypothetical protein [Deltaproteobacteria bacterium]